MGASGPEVNWVHELFQGTLTNETKCLTCEMVSIPSSHTPCLLGAVSYLLQRSIVKFRVYEYAHPLCTIFVPNQGVGVYSEFAQEIRSVRPRTMLGIVYTNHAVNRASMCVGQFMV